MLFLKSSAWYRALPPHLRPPKSKIRPLDAFRRTPEVDDDEVFMVMIGENNNGLIVYWFGVLHFPESTLAILADKDRASLTINLSLFFQQ